MTFNINLNFARTGKSLFINSKNKYIIFLKIIFIKKSNNTTNTTNLSTKKLQFHEFLIWFSRFNSCHFSTLQKLYPLSTEIVEKQKTNHSAIWLCGIKRVKFYEAWDWPSKNDENVNFVKIASNLRFRNFLAPLLQNCTRLQSQKTWKKYF